MRCVNMDVPSGLRFPIRFSKLHVMLGANGSGQIGQMLAPEKAMIGAEPLVPPGEDCLFGGAAPVRAGRLGEMAPAAPVRGLPVGAFPGAGDQEKRRLGWWHSASLCEVNL